MRMFLARLKASEAPQGFVSYSFLGEYLEHPDEGYFILTNTCAILEMAKQIQDPKTKEVKISIEAIFQTDTALTNGSLLLNSNDCIFTRFVNPDDEILNTYNASIEKFRLDKIRIQKASNIPSNISQLGI